MSALLRVVQRAYENGQGHIEIDASKPISRAEAVAFARAKGALKADETPQPADWEWIEAFYVLFARPEDQGAAS